MTNATKPYKNRTLGAILVLIFVVAVSSVMLFALNTKQSIPEDYYISCVAIQGKYARCAAPSGKDPCYGYFQLRSSDIKDGILPYASPELSATCEGFESQKLLYFDKNGNYIQ